MIHTGGNGSVSSTKKVIWPSLYKDAWKRILSTVVLSFIKCSTGNSGLIDITVYFQTSIL